MEFVLSFVLEERAWRRQIVQMVVRFGMDCGMREVREGSMLLAERCC